MCPTRYKWFLVYLAWAKYSWIKVQIPPWFPSSPIDGSHMIHHNLSRAPTSFKWALSKWCSCNMMMSVATHDMYSSTSLLTFHLFCSCSRLLCPYTFHITIFMIMEGGGRLRGVPHVLHNRLCVGSTHHLDIQYFPLMEWWSRSMSGFCALSGELQ